jgi:cytochrome c556
MMAQEKREKLMKSNGGNLGAFNKAMKAGDAAAAATAAKQISANLDELGDMALWPAGSTGGESRAKPEIWSHLDDFKAKLGAAKKAVAEAVTVAEAGNAAGLQGAFKGMAGACGGCHKSYRAPKK